MRFYEIDGGRITLDGVDTSRMDRGELRQQFGMVLQDAWLFDGTIAENIAYGCPEATRGGDCRGRTCRSGRLLCAHYAAGLRHACG